MGLQLTTGQVGVSSTATALSSLTDNFGEFIVRAHQDNTAYVEIGAKGLTAGSGYPLAPGEAISFEYRVRSGESIFERQPRDVYVVGSSGDKVAWIATGQV